eukprot:10865608-Ditylum_brightwellii.AAC.1
MDRRFGDKIDTDISHSVFHNANGINLGNQEEEFLEELTLLKDYGFEYLHLIKTNNNWNKSDTHDRMKQYLSKV